MGLDSGAVPLASGSRAAQQQGLSGRAALCTARPERGALAWGPGMRGLRSAQLRPLPRGRASPEPPSPALWRVWPPAAPHVCSSLPNSQDSERAETRTDARGGREKGGDAGGEAPGPRRDWGLGREPRRGVLKKSFSRDREDAEARGAQQPREEKPLRGIDRGRVRAAVDKTEAGGGRAGGQQGGPRAGGRAEGQGQGQGHEERGREGEGRGRAPRGRQARGPGAGTAEQGRRHGQGQ